MTSRSASNRSRTGVYGVIGRNIGYSLSPHVFRRVFDALGWRADYSVFDIEESELKGLLDAMRTAPIRGLNVTRPYKELVVRYLDRLDPGAAAVGAVNTIVLERGRLVGYNTDIAGVIFALGSHWRVLRGKEAVIFGAGGGARAAAHALLRHLAMRGVTIAARRPARARRLINQLQDRMSPPSVASAAFRPAADLHDALSHAKLIVNATPLGTGSAMGEVPLPKGTRLHPGTIAFDLVYQPRPTFFNRAARRAGCRITIDGWPMLIAQAEAAFRLWTGRRFPATVREKLLCRETLP